MLGVGSFVPGTEEQPAWSWYEQSQGLTVTWMLNTCPGASKLEPLGVS